MTEPTTSTGAPPGPSAPGPGDGARPRRRRFRLEPLLNVLRAALLLVTVAALATAAVWAFRPEWVVAYDEGRVAALEERYDQRLEAAEAALAAAPGTPEGLAPLEALARDLEGIRRGERLYPVRRRALVALVRAHESARELDLVLALRRKLVELDPKDIELQLGLARVLTHVDGRREEALELLTRLQRLMPEDPRVAQALADLLVAEGQPGQAVEVALEQGRKARSTLWRVLWWANPKSPKRQGFVTPLRDGEGRMRLPVRIDGPVRMVRFEPPERLALRLEDPVLRVRYDDVEGEDEYRVMDAAELGGLVANDRQLSTNGLTNAFIELRLKPHASATRTELELVAPFEWGPSPVLSELGARPGLLESLAGAEIETEELARMRTLALEAGLRAPFEVFWKLADQAYVGARRGSAGAGLESRAGGGVGFAVELAVAQRADQLRLDPPTVEHVTWELELLEIVDADGVIPLEPETLEWVTSHSLSREGARFRIEGPDPWLVFDVPGGAREVESLRVRGVLR